MQVFPVDLAGKPYYAQAYNQSHHGTDIFAPRGTQVLAVEPGRVRKDDDPKGGTVVYLTTADGTKYYYAHLDEVIGTMPRTVRAGDIIGLVGNSGNAKGKATHVHFQVSESGLGTVDPYPLLRDVDVKSPTPATTTPSSVRTKTQRTDNNWNGLVILGLLWFATRRRTS
jgi:murein DD-endopeptidase MepM/ murein hydrolase activator NlpD